MAKCAPVGAAYLDHAFGLIQVEFTIDPREYVRVDLIEGELYRRVTRVREQTAERDALPVNIGRVHVTVRGNSAEQRELNEEVTQSQCFGAHSLQLTH